ncbi:unnamed protein product [Caenorhabditis brenneri]
MAAARDAREKNMISGLKESNKTLKLEIEEARLTSKDASDKHAQLKTEYDSLKQQLEAVRNEKMILFDKFESVSKKNKMMSKNLEHWISLYENVLNQKKKLENKVEKLVEASPSRGRKLKKYEIETCDQCNKEKNDPSSNYSISIKKTPKTTRRGKTVTVSSVIVKVVDLEKLIKERLERLAKHDRLIYDEGTKDDIVLGVVCEKGQDLTKICMAFENLDKPNNANALSILGWYTGDDDNKSLRKHLQSVFDLINQLRSIQFSVNGFPVVKNVRFKGCVGQLCGTVLQPSDRWSLT